MAWLDLAPTNPSFPLVLGERAAPDEATWRRNEDDPIGASKDIKTPTLVLAGNRHCRRSRAVRIHDVSAHDGSAGRKCACQAHVIHSRKASVGSK